MGAQIGAHMANAGVPVLLLDVSAEAAARGLARARGLRPDPFFGAEAAALIRTGGFDELAAIRESDWIVEAVVEDAAVKRPLLARVDECRAEHAIVSSNTSGLSITDLANGRSPGFRRHWLGTHFFNPPRYLHLVELIPTPDTDPSVTARVADFADRRLGKGVVMAKDTPAFIANRIGLFGMVRLLEALAGGGYTIEEIDAITGPAIGRPKSATFRTADIAGIDVLAHVTRDLARRVGPEERAHFELPAFVDEMIRRGWLGEKTGQGFYKRVTRGNESVILTLDLDALAAGAEEPYRDRREVPEPDRDKIERLSRDALRPTCEYASSIASEIAQSREDVDRAMRWGYGWQVGPLEMLEGHTRPPRARATRASIRGNASADVIDLGDGVLGVVLHSKMNTVDGDTLAMLRAGVELAADGFNAIVISGEGEHFSAGANLKLLVSAADASDWGAIEQMIRSFQDANMALKTSPVPVVVAAAGLALGGGCEICLHADRVQAAAETYMGLVELGVGLIPAAGGTKEMLARTAPSFDARQLQCAFEHIALARVSTSAPDAKRLGYLRDTDHITMNRDRLMDDAKATALARAREGYRPPQPRADISVGGPDVYALLSLGVHLAERAGRATAHDAHVARKLAWVLAGGDAPHRMVVSEQHLLDLEREAFLSLCGEAKTIERIRHTLKTGKPLRN
jgi:3-hydroxyacyl-CoA dehydrogenase